MKISGWTALLGAAVLGADAIQLDLGSDDSIKQAASTIAHNMMTYYVGNQSGQVPGLLPPPYYWWEAGAMFGSLLDYWYYTGDTTYNDVTEQALLFQVGPDRNYEPTNRTSDLGNDDQAFWGIAAMSAAELKFQNPPEDQPQWLALAQAVFNRQAGRWDEQTCGGGLRWQIFSFNRGYNYKNSISNGCFINLGARLGAYTGNSTYFEWVDKVWDWMTEEGLVSPSFQVFDGTDVTINCTQLDHVQWSYNGGVMLLGAATMWNQTTGDEQSKWGDRVTGLLKENMVFFQNGTTMYEVACEPNNNCNVDQLSFKAYLSRWMAATTKVAPWTADQILPLLASSAQAAAQSCSGGNDGSTCGTKWTQTGWDGAYGVGQQMSALEVIQSNMIQKVSGPVSNKTGGTSKGDYSAGSGSSSHVDNAPGEITMKDKAGAGVLTAVVLIMLLGGGYWMSVD
ncbi:hypothetical protein WHR41_00737 [Cladosporium halotolerans]|uniref:Mannan endo-1,6-alpha-mannosidase n=1 Tax=Cladosporium halotolerans TaxID=1052096 RepID=A0AB34L6G7_9PEZI